MAFTAVVDNDAVRNEVPVRVSANDVVDVCLAVRLNADDRVLFWDECDEAAPTTVRQYDAASKGTIGAYETSRGRDLDDPV